MRCGSAPARLCASLFGVALGAALIAGEARADQSVAELAPRHRQVPELGLEAPWSPVILEIQTALSRLGFYRGSIDGHFSIATGHAVRVYRKAHKLEGASTDWDGLLAHLETQAGEGAEVQSRLERARRAQIRAAREVLNERVELRAALRDDGGTVPGEAPDSLDCFVVPNVDCLFRSAMRSAMAVAREEYRNWALRDLIRAQALAGRHEAALASLKKLTDPRLIFVSLREIAEAMASTGAYEKAVETARLIPEPSHRARALAAVASALSEAEQYLRGREIGGEATRLLAREHDVAERVMLTAAFAEKVATAGDRSYASSLLKSAADDLGEATGGPARDAAWARLARAQLALGDRGAAVTSLDRIEDPRSRAGVAAAGAAEAAQQADAKKMSARLLTSIDDLRYRVLGMCDVAYSQHSIGDTSAAQKMLSRAERMVDDIDSPFAASFARARIAETRARLGQLEAAEDSAGRIEDDALRARTFWMIAEVRRRTGDVAGAERSESRAIDGAATAKSAFDRTTVLADFAVGLARAGRLALARKSYEDALQAAQRIKIDWWRARALARAAGILQELERHGIF